MMQLSVPFLLFFVPNGRSVPSLTFSLFLVLQCDISPMLENGNWLQTTTAQFPAEILHVTNIVVGQWLLLLPSYEFRLTALH